MAEPGPSQDALVSGWRDPEGDYVLPHALRSLPQPWDECDWRRIAELPLPTNDWRKPDEW